MSDYKTMLSEPVPAWVAREIKQMQAENERLRGEIAEHDGILAIWRRRCTDADAENERLRELLNEIMLGPSQFPDWFVKRAREVLDNETL